MSYDLRLSPAPVAPVTPLTPPVIPVKPLIPKYTGGSGIVYAGTIVSETTNADATVTIETDPKDTTFLQAEKPVVGDYMIFTSHANYWYIDAYLKTKYSVPGHPVTDFQRAVSSYAGIYQGKFTSYVDYKGVKRVKSFLVKVKMAYDQSGNLNDTESLLWISAESQFGKVAKDQNIAAGYGSSEGTITPGTGTNTANTGTSSTNSGTKPIWIILIAFIVLWQIKK